MLKFVHWALHPEGLANFGRHNNFCWELLTLSGLIDPIWAMRWNSRLWLSLPSRHDVWIEYFYLFLSTPDQWNSETKLWSLMPPWLVAWKEYSFHFLAASGKWHSNDYQPDYDFWCHSHLLIFDYQPNCGCICHQDLLIEWNTLITSYHYLANDILIIISPIVFFDATLSCW